MLPAFYEQPIEVAPQTGALGGTLTFNLPRESRIAQIDLIVDVTVATAAATAVAEGASAIVQSVTLRGTVPGQAQFQPLNGLTGPDLFELAQFLHGSLPRIIGALDATGRLRVVIPLVFEGIGWGARSALEHIPAELMSDLVLTVRIATQAEVDSNATPTFAITASSMQVQAQVFQYYRETVPQNWPFLRCSYEVIEDTGIVTQTEREIRFPAGGDYDCILIRSFNSATARQTNAQSAPITSAPTTPGRIRVDDLSLLPKIVTDFQKLREQNLRIIVDSLVTGNAAIKWGRVPEDLFQTGRIGQSLNYVKLTYNATAATGSKVRFVYKRYLDDANLLQIPR